MWRQSVSPFGPSTSFPMYSEGSIENRRYNLMSNFGIYMPDDTPITNLLYHSMKLSEDLKKAKTSPPPSAGARGQRGPRAQAYKGAGPVKYRRK
jgi:hypothetical protein